MHDLLPGIYKRANGTVFVVVPYGNKPGKYKMFDPLKRTFFGFLASCADDGGEREYKFVWSKDQVKEYICSHSRVALKYVVEPTLVDL